MKIIEPLERNDEPGKRLPLMGPLRRRFLQSHLPALVAIVKEPRPWHIRISQFRWLYSRQWTSRTPRKSHITKDRGAVYSSQTVRVEIAGVRPKYAELGGTRTLIDA